MLAQAWRQALEFQAVMGEFHRAEHLRHIAAGGIREGFQHLTMHDLFFPEHPAHLVDRSAGNAEFLQPRQPVIEVALQQHLADQRVQAVRFCTLAALVA